jgi:transposase
LDNRGDELFLRMRKLILGLRQNWIWTDMRIEMTTSEIKSDKESEASCQRLMTIPEIGPIISTAVVAAVGTGETYDRGRAWQHMDGRGDGYVCQ